jgi:hypothetical protein
MTLEEFLAMERLPSSDDIMGLCEHLGMSFKTNKDGQPFIRCSIDVKPEAEAIARILKRDPWRSQVMKAKDLAPKQKPDPVDSLPQPCRVCGAMIIWCQSEAETVMPLDTTESQPGDYPLYAAVNGLAIPCDGPGYRQHVQTCKAPVSKRYGHRTSAF